jgi:hypothetical protein
MHSIQPMNTISLKSSKFEQFFKNSQAEKGPGSINFAKNRKLTLNEHRTTHISKLSYDNFIKCMHTSPVRRNEILSNKILPTAHSSSKITMKRKKTLEFGKVASSFEILNLSSVFKAEDSLYTFLKSIYKEEDLQKPFLNYIEVFKEKDFDLLLAKIPSTSLSVTFKNAFILERLGLMICFYLAQKGLYKKEWVFMKKIIVLAYSNIIVFLKYLLNDVCQLQGNVSLLAVQGGYANCPAAELISLPGLH